MAPMPFHRGCLTPRYKRFYIPNKPVREPGIATNNIWRSGKHAHGLRDPVGASLQDTVNHFAGQAKVLCRIEQLRQGGPVKGGGDLFVLRQ